MTTVVLCVLAYSLGFTLIYSILRLIVGPPVSAQRGEHHELV